MNEVTKLGFCFATLTCLILACQVIKVFYASKQLSGCPAQVII